MLELNHWGIDLAVGNGVPDGGNIQLCTVGRRLGSHYCVGRSVSVNDTAEGSIGRIFPLRSLRDYKTEQKSGSINYIVAAACPIADERTGRGRPT